MTAEEREIQGQLAELDELPLTDVLGLDGDDTVLANSLRRIIQAARQPQDDAVAAFQNYI
jgi:FXSXX-COOH protein